MIVSTEQATLIAAAIAAIASLTGAFFAFRATRMQAPQKVAEFRLAWIEALRSDIAALIALATIRTRSDDQVRQMHELQSRIMMRLNRQDTSHLRIRDSVLELIDYMQGKIRGDIFEQVSRTILVCQDVFGFEWRRLKGEIVKGKLSKEELRKEN